MLQGLFDAIRLVDLSIAPFGMSGPQEPRVGVGSDGWVRCAS